MTPAALAFSFFCPSSLCSLSPTCHYYHLCLVVFHPSPEPRTLPWLSSQHAFMNVHTLFHPPSILEPAGSSAWVSSVALPVKLANTRSSMAVYRVWNNHRRITRRMRTVNAPSFYWSEVVEQWHFLDLVDLWLHRLLKLLRYSCRPMLE